MSLGDPPLHGVELSRVPEWLIPWAKTQHEYTGQAEMDALLAEGERAIREAEIEARRAEDDARRDMEELQRAEPAQRDSMTEVRTDATGMGVAELELRADWALREFELTIAKARAIADRSALLQNAEHRSLKRPAEDVASGTENETGAKDPFDLALSE